MVVRERHYPALIVSHSKWKRSPLTTLSNIDKEEMQSFVCVLCTANPVIFNTFTGNLTMGRIHMDELEPNEVELDESACLLCGKDILTCVCTESDLDRFIFGMIDEEVDS